MNSTTVGWVWFVNAWINLTLGVYNANIGPVVIGLIFFPLAIMMLWDGSEP